MRSALFSLALLCALGDPLGAQEIDGLNAGLRKSFYNERTAIVAKLALPQLRQQPLLQTFYGFFDPASLGHIRGSSKNFDREIGEMIAGYTAVASGMVAANYTRATVVGIDNSGFNLFAVVPLGMDMDDGAYAAAEFALGGVFSATGMPIEITRRQDFVLIHAPRAVPPAAEHSAEVERLVLTALEQPRVASAVAFAVQMTGYVRGAIASSAGGLGDFSQVLGQADYCGGYLVGGERPELHFYLRFGSEAAAANAQALYAQSWNQQIAAAFAAAEAQAKAEAAGEFVIKVDSWIDDPTLYRRLAAATSTTVFGNVLLLDLDTTDLREITGALVDRYYRKARKRG
jgi:hypothetical protein